MALCNLCPRRCNAMRGPDRGEGYCHMGTLPGRRPRGGASVGGAMHQRNAGQRHRVFQRLRTGMRVLPERIHQPPQPGTGHERAGAERTVCAGGGTGRAQPESGDPLAFRPGHLRGPAPAQAGIPVVWNSSGYETVELVEAAARFVDVFLPDLKYFSAETAQQLAGAPDYFPVAMAAIRAMCQAKGAPVYDADGLMQSGTLVRHLILPLRTSESLRILDAIAEELPSGTPVSLMRQYTPMNGVNLPGLDRRLTAREYARVRDYMLALGLEGYLQSRESADSAFTPAFMDGESTQLFPSERADAEN